MTNYASSPIQPIAHALLLSFSIEAIVANQKGFSSIVYNGPGDYTLTLDPGLPGDVAVQADGSINDQPRCFVTVRSGFSSGVTTIDQKSVNYIPSANPNAGVSQIRVLLAANGTPTDPTGAAGGGVEIVVFRVPGPAVFQQTLVGPLYQPVQVL